MSRSQRPRVTRWLPFAALAVCVAQACSSSTESSTPTAPSGPPTLAVTSPEANSSTALQCDNTLLVELSFTNWLLRPPYNCGTTAQCGSVLVTLLETADGPALASQRAATSAVQLDLTALVTPRSPQDPKLSQVHFVKAELYGDALTPFVVPAGGQGSDIVPVSLTADGCLGAAGAGGAAGAAAGSAGAADNSGGAGGVSGANAGGSAGTGAMGGQPSEAGTGGQIAAAGAAPI